MGVTITHFRDLTYWTLCIKIFLCSGDPWLADKQMQRFWFCYNDQLWWGSGGHSVSQRIHSGQQGPPSILQNQQGKGLRWSSHQGSTWGQDDTNYPQMWIPNPSCWWLLKEILNSSIFSHITLLELDQKRKKSWLFLSFTGIFFKL